MENSTDAYLSAHKRAIQVILIESHALICSAVRQYCTDIAGVAVAAATSSISEALLALERIAPQVLLLAPSISISDCLYLVASVPRWPTGPGIIAMQTDLSAEAISALASSGVHGLLSEAATGSDLANAIAMVAGGNSYMDRHTRDLLAAYAVHQSVDLTQRERDVLALLMRGFSNFEVARALQLKTKTIEMHLTRIYEKLGVRSRTEALVCAQQLYGSILFPLTVTASKLESVHHRRHTGIPR